MSYTLIYVPSPSNPSCLSRPYGFHLNLGQNMTEAEAVKVAVEDVVSVYTYCVMQRYEREVRNNIITTQGGLVDFVLSLMDSAGQPKVSDFYVFYVDLQSHFDIEDDYLFVNAERAHSRDYNAQTPLKL